MRDKAVERFLIKAVADFLSTVRLSAPSRGEWRQVNGQLTKDGQKQLKSRSQEGKLRTRAVRLYNGVEVRHSFFRVDGKNYAIISKILGEEGAVGKVKLVVKEDSDDLFVVKIMSDHSSAQNRERIANSLASLSKIPDAIVSWCTRGSDFYGTKTYAILPFHGMDIAELLKYVADHRPFKDVSKNLFFHLALGMVKAVAELHDKGQVHRDIKLNNFLVDKNGTVRLCDLDTVVHTSKDNKPRNVGCLLFLSPEVRLGGHRSIDFFKADTFCLASALYILAQVLLNDQKGDDVVRSMRDKSSGAVIPPEKILLIEAALKLTPMNKMIALMAHPSPKERPKLSDVIADLQKLQEGSKEALSVDGKAQEYFLMAIQKDDPESRETVTTKFANKLDEIKEGVYAGKEAIDTLYGYQQAVKKLPDSMARSYLLTAILIAIELMHESKQSGSQQYSEIEIDRFYGFVETNQADLLASAFLIFESEFKTEPVPAKARLAN